MLASTGHRQEDAKYNIVKIMLSVVEELMYDEFAFEYDDWPYLAWKIFSVVKYEFDWGYREGSVVALTFFGYQSPIQILPFLIRTGKENRWKKAYD